jgi:hypothetical protein
VNRRDALKGISLLLGSAITPSVAHAMLTGYRPPLAGQTPRTLTTQQNELVATLTELIIPATDTPGARAARVDAFIDGLLTDIFTSQERTRFLGGLADVDARARGAHNTAFLGCTPNQQIAILAGLEAEGERAVDGPRPFFQWLKELTLVGYYTSEIGASQELSYVHVAGAYDGNVPYEKVGRAYS